MNVFDVFEDRMAHLFEGSEVQKNPLPFKRLARKAQREMNHEMLVINGRDTAPALFTILVSPEDDHVIAPFYPETTQEFTDFIRQVSARQKAYFIGDPLVRFLVDHNMRPGKFEVIAENVNVAVLEKLRRDENEYYHSRGLSPQQGSRFVDENSQRLRPSTGGRHASFDQSYTHNNPAVSSPIVPANFDPFVDEDASLPGTPRSASQPRHSVVTPKCTLTEKSTGKVHSIKAPSALIGRTGGGADVIINDTNVSRKHARLSYSNGNWVISDQGSVNGTLVDGNRVNSTVLRSGQTVRLGLIDLTFRGE